MPNECFNSFSVNGKCYDMVYFIQFMNKDFNNINEKILPYPKERQEIINNWEYIKTHNDDIVESDLEKDPDQYWYGKKGGYIWCYENWGSKSGMYELECSRRIKHKNKMMSIDYHFISAWTPPLGLLRALSKKFDKLNFYFYWDEPMEGFEGELCVKKGKEIFFEERDIIPCKCDSCDNYDEEEYCKICNKKCDNKDCDLCFDKNYN